MNHCEGHYTTSSSLAVHSHHFNNWLVIDWSNTAFFLKQTIFLYLITGHQGFRLLWFMAFSHFFLSKPSPINDKKSIKPTVFEYFLNTNFISLEFSSRRWNYGKLIFGSLLTPIGRAAWLSPWLLSCHIHSSSVNCRLFQRSYCSRSLWQKHILDSLFQSSHTIHSHTLVDLQDPWIKVIRNHRILRWTM